MGGRLRGKEKESGNVYFFDDFERKAPVVRLNPSLFKVLRCRGVAEVGEGGGEFHSLVFV